MAKFEKKILKKGTYHSPDGEIIIDDRRMTHWVDSFSKMKGAGLQIPVPWGHQSKARPDDKEFASSKYNGGFMDSLTIDKDGDLATILDIPLEEDAKRLGTVVKEVSPQIETAFRDGSGRIWNDVITHLALVTLPVVSGQENFKEIIIDSPLPKYALRLSLSNLKGDEKMADEGKKGPVDSELLDLLASVHLVVPPDVKDVDEFMVALKAAVMTLKDQLDKMDADGGDDDFSDLQLPPLDQLPQQAPPAVPMNEPNAPPPGAKPLQEEVPMQSQMSLKDNVDHQNAIKRLSLVERKLEEETKKSLKGRLDNLLKSGRITPVIAHKLEGSVKIYKLSLTSEGEPENSEIEAMISTFELLPEHCTFSTADRVRMSSAVEDSLPTDFGNLDEASADKIADEQLKWHGRALCNN